MNTRYAIAALAGAAVLAAGGYALYQAGVRHGGMGHGSVGTAPASGLKAGDVDPANGRKILYYHDPMVPGAKFDKPGKSPFMDMPLVAVHADGDTDSGKVTVSARTQQNLGVRTAAVMQGPLAPQISAVGSVAFNERDQAFVQARAAGFVERLHVRAALDRVVRGQPLMELYVPDWVAAQEEFLALKRSQADDLAELVDGARQRMRQVGMNDEQIRGVERTGKTQARITITAPLAGVVTELSAREGMTVAAGAPLFRINGLSTVWANAEVPESQAALLRPGARVRAQSPAAHGVNFEGRLQAILPDVSAATRTVKARMELANPGFRLVPGMFVSMQFVDAGAVPVLQVPTEAVIQTGRRAVVILAEDNGRFRPQEVQTGVEAAGQTEIRGGLQAGQKVVVSSQFLIDSEASLKGVEARLNQAAAPPVNTPPRYETPARVEGIAKDALTLWHPPIPALQWGAMTMEFKPPPLGALPPGLKVGQQVQIEFFMAPDGAQLTRIAPLAGPEPRK